MCKRLLSIFAVLLLLAVPVFGTVTATRTSITDSTGQSSSWLITFTWSGANATGSTTSSIDGAIRGWYLTRAETTASGSPTACYDIAVNTASGADLMGGNLVDRSQTAAQIAYPATASPLVDGAITLVITNQSEAGASGTVKLYFARSPASGTLVLGTVTVTPATADAANGAAMTNPPVPIAFALSTDETLGQMAAVDPAHALYVNTRPPLSVYFQYSSTSTASTEIEAFSAASMSGYQWVILGILCTNSSATTEHVDIYDTTATNSLMVPLTCPAASLGGQGGAVFPIGSGPRSSALSKGLFIKPTTGVTTLTISVWGIKKPNLY